MKDAFLKFDEFFGEPFRRSNANDFFLVVVKVRCVTRALGLGNKWSVNLALNGVHPVCGRKPLMSLDVVDTVFQIPEAFGQVNLKQMNEQIFEVIGKMGWETNFARDDLLVDLDGLVSEEGRIAEIKISSS